MYDYDPEEHPIAEMIADFICTYFSCFISGIIFTFLFQIEITFSEYFLVGYCATMFQYFMRWITGSK